MAGVRHENKPESVYLPRSDEYLTDGNTLSGNATYQDLVRRCALIHSEENAGKPSICPIAAAPFQSMTEPLPQNSASS
jgi:hypothetical protein